MSEKLTRRDVLVRASQLAAVGACGGLLLSATACSKGGGGGSVSCNDTSGLSEDEIATRTSAGYVESSMRSGQNCENCSLYEAPAEGESCGGCQSVPGPINPEGWCNLWIAAG